jgi:cell division protein FtsL
MNPFEFVLIIVAMAFGMAIIIKKMEFAQRRHRGGEKLQQASSSQENDRLRHEVAELKERLKVLERVTVEKESRLSSEIENLRDR